MPKNQNKTQPTTQSVHAFIKSLAPNVQSDAKVLLKAFEDATGMHAVMWGNIVGFGKYHYKYESGREGDFMATGFAMRKSGPTIYIMPGYQDYNEMLKKLDTPYKLGKSCLYLKNTDGLNIPALKKLITQGVKDLGKFYPVERT